MAKTQNTLIGRSSGSVGGATFSTWKGINVLKSKPLTVANPRTRAQLNTREMFAALVALYRSIAGIVKVGFASQAVKKSEFNAFLSNAMKVGLPIQIGTSFLDWADMQDFLAAKGSMGKTNFAIPTAVAGEDFITVAWSGPFPVGGSNSDEVYALAIDATGTVVGVANGQSSRNQSDTSIQLVRDLVLAEKIHVYTFFRNPESGDVEDSVYNRIDVTA